MDQPFLEKRRRKLRILVAPLDWGLGHATRCIPVIWELLKQGCEVILAGEGVQEALLKNEFPQLSFLSLKGYRIRYSRSGVGLLWRIIRQVPQINKAIRNEHQWLKEAVKEYQLDAVISDNRYGLYHEKISCIFITHQLLIKTYWGGWSEKMLQKRNIQHINHFSECWIPDYENEKNFAGALSHPDKKPSIPIHYIGWLSRIEKKNIATEKDHLLFLLSGPEPQRTILEELIIEQIAHYKGTATIIRGLPNSASLIPSTNSIKFYNHLPADELGKEMERAEYIIARSGYSTVMDLMTLQKKSILIPTPGQTEQKYLAEYLSGNQIAMHCSQKGFSIEGCLVKAKNFPYRFFNMEGDKLSPVISKLLQSVGPA